MKLETTDTNYNAIIVKCNNFVDLEWCDNVKGLPMFWRQAIVSKDLQPWTLGILFWPEVALSHSYCNHNNLYRHSELNANPEIQGYISDNGRVKALKFRWHTSNALFMPLESLSYLNIPFNTLNVWDIFNNIDGIEICKKYRIIDDTNKHTAKTYEKTWSRITNKTFPEHTDTENYWRNVWMLKDNDWVVVTQKIHWCASRFWYLQSQLKPKWRQKMLWTQPTEYEHHFGSRRVIKTLDTKNSKSFYKTDVRWKVNERIQDVIPKNWIIYWEIVGRDWNKPIQKWYTYDVPEWAVELYVYRISVVNPDWILSDLSWTAIKEFCIKNGLKYVPELWVWRHQDLNIDEFMDKRYADMWYNAVPLSDKSLPDEWVVVRREWIIPYLLKAKCSSFLEHETKLLDTGVVDLETEW